MPSDERKRAIELVAGGIAVALLFAYSVLVIGRPLAAIGLVIPLVVLYLLWRLVRATERIATAAVTATNSPTSRLWQLVQATERIADAAEDDGPAADRSTDDDSVGDDGPGAGRDDDGDAGAP